MRGHCFIMAVLPTGTGKTVMYVSLAEDFWRNTGENVLILAHRKKLITQTRDKFFNATDLPYESIQIEMGDARALSYFDPPIVVGSVASMGTERLLQYRRDYFGLIIVDECHHAVSDSYKRIFSYFNQATVVGVTATAERGDGKSLGKVFNTVCYLYKIEEAIKDGYLVPILSEIIPMKNVNLDDIEAIGDGDFTDEQIAEKMEIEENVHKVVKVTLSRSENRPTIIFGASIRHIQLVCEALNIYNPGCARYVASNLSSTVCDGNIRDFENGDYQYLCNVDMLTEGVDIQRASCVAIARITKSRPVHIQRVGRVLRLLGKTIKESISNGKPNCLVLDFVGASDKHKLITVLDSVFCDTIPQDVAQEVRKLIYSGKSQSVDEAIVMAEDIIRERIALKVGSVEFASRSVDPFRDTNKPDKYRAHLIEAIQQYTAIEGGEYLQNLTTMELIDLFREYRANGKCVSYQVRALKKYGLPTNMTYKHADMIIRNIKMNGGRVDESTKEKAKEYTKQFNNNEWN